MSLLKYRKEACDHQKYDLLLLAELAPVGISTFQPADELSGADIYNQYQRRGNHNNKFFQVDCTERTIEKYLNEFEEKENYRAKYIVNKQQVAWNYDFNT